MDTHFKWRGNEMILDIKYITVQSVKIYIDIKKSNQTLYQLHYSKFDSILY